EAPGTGRKRRVVAEPVILVEAVDDVDAEPGHAPAEPESQDLPELLVDAELPPVQVRLAGQEVVQVVLPAGTIEGPSRRSRDVCPVVGRATPVGGVGPDVVVAVRRVPG